MLSWIPPDRASISPIWRCKAPESGRLLRLSGMARAWRVIGLSALFSCKRTPKSLQRRLLLEHSVFDSPSSFLVCANNLATVARQVLPKIARAHTPVLWDGASFRSAYE